MAGQLFPANTRLRILLVITTVIILQSLRDVDCQYPPPPRPKACATVGKASDQEIADRFFAPYGNWQRPRINSSDVVAVNLTFAVGQIIDIIETQRTILLSGYLSIRWVDEFRVWQDAFPYNCVDFVVLPSELMWVPDVAQMNSDSRYNILKMEGEKVRIYKNGYSWYSPGGTFKAYCQFDFTLFPFDTQTCALRVESWRYPRQYMTFAFGNNISLLNWQDHEQWTLVNTYQTMVNATYIDPSIAFDHADFYIVIARKSGYYAMNVIIPSMIIAVAQLATFTLPQGEVERIDISFTCLLAYSVFQLMVAGDMPRSSVHIPLLSIYIDLQMGYIALSMIGEGISFLCLENLHPIQANGRPGRWVPRCILALFSFIGWLILIGPISQAISHPSKSKMKEQKGKQKKSPNKNGTKSVEPSQVKGDPSPGTDVEGGNVIPGVDLENVDVASGIDLEGVCAADADVHYSQDDHHLYNGEYVDYNTRQLQWRYVAHVIQRINAVMYFSAIAVTPSVIFSWGNRKK